MSLNLTSEVLLIRKPPGPTSHDIVDAVRRITGERRVGHAGTLDPFAEGLLIILVGRNATKKQNEFMKQDKEYIAVIRLGAESDTNDLMGNIAVQNFQSSFGKREIEKALENFSGEIEQVPPAFSAVKVRGKKSYEYARKGQSVDLEPRKVFIRSITVIDYKWPLITLKIRCSSGTYIRSIARDLGKELGCGAYVEKLVRTKIGQYDLKNSVKLEDVTKPRTA